MKKIIHALLMISILSACNTRPSTSTQPISMRFIPFHKIHVYTDIKLAKNTVVIIKNIPLKNESSKLVAYPAKIKAGNINNLAKPRERLLIPITVKTIKAPQASFDEPINANILNTDAKTASAEIKQNAGNSSAPVLAIKEKTSWSNACKDALMGGAGGAIGGAIISKKKARGAIIGGIIGAAGGYILGRTKDNKQPENTYPLVSLK